MANKQNDSNTGEITIFETRYHWIIFVIPSLILLLAGFLYWKQWLLIWYLSYPLAVIGGVYLLWELFNFLFVKFVVTDECVRKNIDFLTLSWSSDIPLAQVENANHFSLTEGIMNCGNVSFKNGSEKHKYKTIVSPKVFKEAIYKAQKFQKGEIGLEDIQPSISNNKNGKKEFWQYLPVSTQTTLAWVGIITVDASTTGDDGRPYFATLERSFRKCKTPSERRRFLRSFISETEREQDRRIVGIRFSTLRDVLNECLTGLGTHPIQVSEEEGKELIKLRDDIKEIRYEVEIELLKKEEENKILSSLREIIHSRKIELEDKVIVIPSLNPSDGYFPIPKSVYPTRGDWVGIGEPILETNQGVIINSPISGVVTFTYSHANNLIEIIPQKNYKLPQKVSDFLFKEYIDLDLENWVMDGGLDKWSNVAGQYTDPTEYMRKVREAVKNYKLLEEEIDDEMKSLIENVKAETK